MSSSTSPTTCPQCTYAECMREYNTNSNFYLNCPYCGYYESWVGSEHTVAAGAGCISYILPSGAVHTQYLPIAAEVESAALWLREHLSTGEFCNGYVNRWDADTHTVETVVGKFCNFFFEIPDDEKKGPPAPIELTFHDTVPETLLKIDPVYIDPFDTGTDTLSDGSPRCDRQYYAIDEYGDSEKARCTRAATQKIRVTSKILGTRLDENKTEIYDAKACRRCADSAVKSAGTMGSPLAVEILGEAE